MSLNNYSKATRETAENLRIIDDALFRLMAEKLDVCQEILCTLLDEPLLQVLKVESQAVIKSLHREITLDALCIMPDGDICNIEMQKGNSNDDVARTRFHASAITAKYTPKGTEFSDIPDVTIVYITEYDALHNGKAVTHVSRCMEKEEGVYVPVNDGEDIVFANTCIDDGTDKSKLLQLMLKKEAFYDEKFPALSNAVKYFKETEGGKIDMCKAVEELAINYANEFRIKMIADYISNGGTPEDAIKMLNASESEVKKATELLQLV